MSTAEQIEDLTNALNTVWVLICTFLVFWEQAGFAMWEAGSLRRKNVHNILLKNLLDAAIGVVAFMTCGYAVAFGESAGGGFIGKSGFFMADMNDFLEHDYASWFFQWAFAATAATTVSGCMAERTRFEAYLIYTFVITAFIYPVVVHWLWADDGWLCAWGDNGAFGHGMIDFAGSAVVHMVGGVAGLVGSFLVGPRLGRFDKAVDQKSFDGHSVSLSTIGVYCLWFGWFGFNAGYTLKVTSGNFRIAAVICVNTVVSPAFAALTCLVFEKCVCGFYDLPNVLNAVVSGLVGITGPCGVVSPAGAVGIGVVSGLVYCGSIRMHARLRIDDPVCAVAVHAWPGLWGAIAPGFLATSEQVKALDYNASAGLFYGGSMTQLLVQCLGSVSILAWTAVMSAMVFFPLKLGGVLRVSMEEEEVGLDVSKHGVKEPVLENKQSAPIKELDQTNEADESAKREECE